MTVPCLDPFLERGEDEQTLSAVPQLRRRFRATSIFGNHSKTLTRKVAKKGLMSEGEARLQEHTSDPATAVQQCIDNGELFLDLSYAKLEELPSNLESATSLTNLNLMQNSIRELPEEIGSLTGLKYLNLSVNRIKEIPYTVVQWEQITEINLSSNLLSSLPEEFGFLMSLRTLTLDFNYFTEIPDCLCELEIEKLYIVENSGITEFPDREWFESFQKPLEIAIDNSPSLSRSWDEMKDTLPLITIKWNKIWPDHVSDGIYLGSLRTAQNQTVFEQLNITHVLTCGRNMKTSLPKGTCHLQLEVEDNEVEDLSPHFNRAIAFIKSAIDQKGSVLIHCFAGVSRSSTVCIAYLMREKGMHCDDAIGFLKTCRPAINPNPSFRLQLHRFQELLSSCREG
eukprot:TRINITY_DN8303_c0_g1_i1.p1 TRINITY_DN8303_c0_g1~~TRINITY_DN8303_c0_g1_i1.p1  ORF type:complete len:436 (+),score=69.34 TRINITY_DN8303_c0_g1_i1:120-1310(+)